MGCIYQSDATLANATLANAIAGNRFEFLAADSYVSVGFTQSATGMLCNVSLSDRLLAANISPVVKATAPIRPDDYVLSMQPGLAGERLVIEERNTTGGTLTVFLGVCIDEVM